MIGTDSAFAAYLGVNKSSISRARKAGRLVLDDQGRVDFEKSAAKWHETTAGRTDVAERHAAHRGAAIPQARPQQQNAPARDSASAIPETAAPASGETRASAKAAVLHYENSLIKLEMALRRGLRLDRATLLREAHGLGAVLRAGVERLIDQSAPRLAVASGLQRRVIISEAVRRLKWIFRRELPRALRRTRAQSAPISSGAQT